jgi:diacylglycerol kinase (ATP)
MTQVAVVAHRRKNLGGGLGELRAILAREGVTDPLWLEVDKSRKAPARARRALREGAELIFVWGGDGTVQRCVDALAGTGAALAVLPAGTANLLAANLGIPRDLEAAVHAGLHGERRALDTGTVNGEHFAVMAGAGFDAAMIAGAGSRLKAWLGRGAYLYAAARSLRAPAVPATVEMDGQILADGPVSCVLAANVGRVLGGLQLVPGARPDDGLLDFGVVSAASPVQWARTLSRVGAGQSARSPFVALARGRQARVRFARALPREVDGGTRAPAADLLFEVSPAAITVCVPEPPMRRPARRR